MRLKHLILILSFHYVAFISAQGVRISFQPAAGSTFNTRFNTAISFTQEAMGIKYTTDTRISNEIVTEVTGRTEEGYSLNCRYSDIEFILKSPSLDLNMSSVTQDTFNPMNILMRSIVGKKFTRLASGKNETNEIRNLDEIIMDELKNINLPEEQKEEFKMYFLQSFGENAITEMYRQDAAFYPDSMVYEGQEWFRSMTTNTYGIPMHLILNVKLKELSTGFAIIMAEGMLAAKSTGNADGTSYKLEGNQVSEIRINLLTGHIESALTTQYINGTIIVPSPDSTANVEMPLNIRSRTKRELVNK